MLDSLQMIKSKLNYKPTKLHIFEDIHNSIVPHARYAPEQQACYQPQDGYAEIDMLLCSESCCSYMEYLLGGFWVCKRLQRTLISNRVINSFEIQCKCIKYNLPRNCKLSILKQSVYIKIILVNSKLQNNCVPGGPLPIVLVTKMCPKCDRHGTSLRFLCDGLSLEVFQLPLSEWFQENLKSRVQPKNTTCSMPMGCLGGLYYLAVMVILERIYVQ